MHVDFEIQTPGLFRILFNFPLSQNPLSFGVLSFFFLKKFEITTVFRSFLEFGVF